MQNRSRFNLEFRVVRADGGLRWLYASGMHKLDAAGRPVYFAGVFSDISAKKATEATLQLERYKLEAVFNGFPGGHGAVARASEHL